MLAVITKTDYKNIEEVCETRNFLKQMQDKNLMIDRLKTGVENKVAVLDENLCD